MINKSKKGVSMSKNVHVFPTLKKYDIQVDEDTTHQEIDALVSHYMNALLQNFSIHGFDMSKKFHTDLKYVEDYMKSAMLRNIGKFHSCQDYIDDFEEYVENKKD